MTAQPITDARPGTVFVTGGSSGLGAAVVTAVAKAGGTPAVLALEPPEDESIAYRLVDLADSSATGNAVEDLVAQVGPPDALVAAAGIDACGTLAEVPADQWNRVIEVNLIGAAAAVRACLPHLVDRRGRIVTVASTLGLRSLSDASAYCASKFGVVGFTRAITLELAGQVGVTLLVPGGMRTPFFDGRPEQYRPAPDASLVEPADMAAAVLFALSQPPGCEVRELVVTSDREPSWP